MTHVRVEFGLDAWAQSQLNPPAIDSDALRNGDVSKLLQDASIRTYGWEAGHEAIQKTQQAMARAADWIPRLNASNSACLGIRGHGETRVYGGAFRVLVHAPVRLLTWLFLRKSFAHALTHPVSPGPWLVEEHTEAIRASADTFTEQVAGCLRDLSDYNLDIGEVEPDPPQYSLTVETLHWLETARATHSSAEAPSGLRPPKGL